MQRLVALKALSGLLLELQSVVEARDSDRLDALSAQYRQAFAQLKELPLARSDDPDAVAIAALANEILERQKSLAAAAEPWMGDLKIIFRERRNEEVLASAYRQTG